MERFADLNEEEKKKLIFGAAIPNCQQILIGIAKDIENNLFTLEQDKELVLRAIDMIIYMNKSCDNLDPKIIIPSSFHSLLEDNG